MKLSLLALIKLRSGPVRTLITVLLTALLFGLIVTAITLSHGLTNSLNAYKENGLNDRHIVTAITSHNQASEIASDPTLIARAKTLYDKNVQEKKDFARSVGAEYSSHQDILPVVAYNHESERLTAGTPITDQVLMEYYQAHPLPGMAELKDLAKPYAGTTFFTIDVTKISNGTLDYIDASGNEVDDDSVPLLSKLTLMPEQLTKPFIFKKTAWQPASGNIPLVMKESDAEKVLGLKPLKDIASPAEQVARIKEVYQKANGFTFDACYRNNISLAAASDLNLKDCSSPKAGQLPSKSEAQKAFDDKFSIDYEAKQQIVTFEIVGVSPDSSNSSGQITSFDSAIKSVISGATIATSVPRDLYDAMNDQHDYKSLFGDGNFWIMGPSSQTYLAEFSSKTDAETFIRNNSCHSTAVGKCMPADKHFMLSLFDDSAAAFDDIKSKVSAVYFDVLVATIVLSMIIACILVSRTSAGNRRESAIYRAIGFSRGRIAYIYLLYSLVLALLIAILAVIFGLTGAYLINLSLSPQLTVQAQLVFGLSSSNTPFSLFQPNFVQTGYIVLLIVASSLTASLLPILVAAKRNPIRDLRAE